MLLRAGVPSTFVILSLFVAACRPSTPERPWADQIAADRGEKDAMFRDGAESPLLPENKASFKGLSYFAIDESYRVPASLTVAPNDARSIVKMPTSTGQMRDMVRVGRLAFMLKGQALQLSAFVEAGESRVDRLFVPFSDLTTGRETYAGGRYLDLTRSPSGVYDLDFNRAYHPYCLYNATYDCPYPPRENRLPLAVRAGERLPHLTGQAGPVGFRPPPVRPDRRIHPFEWALRIAGCGGVLDNTGLVYM